MSERLSSDETIDAEELRFAMGGHGETLTLEQIAEAWRSYSKANDALWLLVAPLPRGWPTGFANFAGWLIAERMTLRRRLGNLGDELRLMRMRTLTREEAKICLELIDVAPGTPERLDAFTKLRAIATALTPP